MALIENFDGFVTIAFGVESIKHGVEFKRDT